MSSKEGLLPPYNIRELTEQLVQSASNRARRPFRDNQVFTGFNLLDDVIWGFKDGEAILLAASEGMGKRCLALNIVDHLCGDDGCTVAYFTRPGTKSRIAARMISINTGVDVEELCSSRDVLPYDVGKIGDYSKHLSGYQLVIDDTTGLKLGAIKNRCDNWKKEGIDLNLVIIDYLQLIRIRGLRKGKDYYRISEQLKALAVELGCPVLVLSSLPEFIEKRKFKRPLKEDLEKAYGPLTRIYDKVLFLYRDRGYSNREAEISVIKGSLTGATRLITLEVSPYDGRLGGFLCGKFRNKYSPADFPFC